MPSPEEVRAAVVALRGQIPETMTASHMALDNLIAARDLGGVELLDPQVALEKVVQALKIQTVALVHSVVMLESRIEHLSGRPGFSDERIDAILSEFTGT